MEVTISFTEGKKLECRLGDHVVVADQPVEEGGQGGAPSPSDYLLVSLATCGAYYARGFCDMRGIALEGFHMDARPDPETKLFGRFEYTITVPGDFPDKYRKPLERAVSQCFVKKHFETPPAFEVRVEKGL